LKNLVAGLELTTRGDWNGCGRSALPRQLDPFDRPAPGPPVSNTSKYFQESRRARFGTTGYPLGAAMDHGYTAKPPHSQPSEERPRIRSPARPDGSGVRWWAYPVGFWLLLVSRLSLVITHGGDHVTYLIAIMRHSAVPRGVGVCAPRTIPKLAQSGRSTLGLAPLLVVSQRLGSLGRNVPYRMADRIVIFLILRRMASRSGRWAAAERQGSLTRSALLDDPSRQDCPNAVSEWPSSEGGVTLIHAWCIECAETSALPQPYGVAISIADTGY